jgi:hypothetical protein
MALPRHSHGLSNRAAADQGFRRGQANFFLARVVPEIIPLSRTTGMVVLLP